MKYHIDTIPVWDAVKSACDCPVCLMYKKIEDKSVEFFSGASVMEPDIRVQVNQKGFCSHHQQLLYAQKNRLGHALMMLSHATETLDKIKKLQSTPRGSGGSRFTLFGKGKGTADVCNDASVLSQISGSCIICDRIDDDFQSYLYTFIHLYKTYPAFPKALASTKGLCIPHASVLLGMAQNELNGEQYSALRSLLLEKISSNLEQTVADLDGFTRKFDYRNADQPWGNSRDANERAINLINGHCIGNIKTK